MDLFDLEDHFGNDGEDVEDGRCPDHCVDTDTLFR